MKVLYIIGILSLVTLVSTMNSCNNPCLNEVFLETLEMDYSVNSSNLGILTGEPRNSGDTIRSLTNQLYNNPEFRRFGDARIPKPSFFITTAYASDDCPTREEYVSLMDLSKTTFRIDKDYDAAALGLGTINADTDLLSISEIRNAYLSDFKISASSCQ